MSFVVLSVLYILYDMTKLLIRLQRRYGRRKKRREIKKKPELIKVKPLASSTSSVRSPKEPISVDSSSIDDAIFNSLRHE